MSDLSVLQYTAILHDLRKIDCSRKRLVPLENVGTQKRKIMHAIAHCHQETDGVHLSPPIVKKSENAFLAVKVGVDTTDALAIVEPRMDFGILT